MTEAAVGSISHIIHTAFKDEFEKKKKAEEYVARQEIKAAKAAKRAEKLRLLEEERLRQEEEQKNSKTPAKNKGKDVKQTSVEIKTAATEVDDDDDEVGGEDVVEDVSDVNPLDSLPLSEYHRTLLNEKLSKINVDLDTKVSEADNLLSYLKQQRQSALEEEVIEEENLKKQGIMLGQHIPTLKSKLEIKKSKLSQYEKMSSNLVLSKDLVEENHVTKMRRTGMLPLSEEAEYRKSLRRLTDNDDGTQQKHYLAMTGSQRQRVTINTKKYETVLSAEKTGKMLEAIKSPKKGPEIPKRTYGVSMAQKEKDKAVLDAMNSRIQYLKNPRNDPNLVTKVLTKGHSPNKQAQEDESSPKYMKKMTAVSDCPLFVTKPSAVHFKKYEIGKEYRKTIIFRNISAVSRSLRIISPQSKYFNIAPLNFPPHCSNGMIAPGMQVSTEVIFKPNSLLDFQDSLEVQTEGGSYSVSIFAQREAPQLSLPSVINIGSCLIGDATRVPFVITNTGGAGSFRIYADESQIRRDESDGSEIDWNGCLRLLPFTLYPLEFTIGKNQSVELTIEYVPLEFGFQEQSLVFVSDSGQIIHTLLKGKSVEVDILLSEINSVPLTNDPSIIKDLVFSPCTLATESEQEIVISNGTGIPLEFEWVWVETNCKDMRRSSLSQIANREAFAGQKSLTEGLELDDDDFRHTRSGQHSSSNASMNGFRMTPSRGVLPTHGNFQFVVQYRPSIIESVSAKAVLVLRSVTNASIPGKRQNYYVDKLLAEKHGAYHRLMSWIEEVGMELPLENAVPLSFVDNGGYVEKQPNHMINLETLLSIVNLHGGKSAQQSDLDIIKRKVYHIVSECHLHLNRTEQDYLMNVHHDDDENDASSLYEVVDLYQWSIVNETEFAAMLPAIKFPKLVETSEDTVDLASYRSLMKTLWITSSTFQLIVGREVCEMLDNKVTHEAVEFIQRCSRLYVPTIAVNIAGKGKLPQVIMMPPCLIVGGLLSVGKTWTGTLSFTNVSDVSTSILIHSDQIVVKSTDNQILQTAPVVVTLSNNNPIILPFDAINVDVSVIANSLGSFEISIPVSLANNSIVQMPDILISVKTIGPMVRFETPEIDIGLISTGMESKTLVSFTNDTDIPLKFNLSVLTLDYQIASSHTQASGAGLLTSRKQSIQSISKSTTRDDDAMSTSRSVATDGTPDSYAIENVHATLSCMPPSGELSPHQSVQFTLLCVGGKFPQRIRANCECIVSDLTGSCVMPTQIVSVRGEVQSPKTIIHPLYNDLGEVYVNAPMKFEIVIQNLTNLPSKFKLERPGGESTSFRLKFSERSGTLGQLEKKVISIEFVGLMSGSVDEVIACKVFGMSTPIGFNFNAKVKGIQCDFLPLAEGESIPKPLGEATDTQYKGAEPLPSPSPIVPLEFGSGVELYARRFQRFCIRNLSAIPFTFELKPKKYDVGSGQLTSRTDGSSYSITKPVTAKKGMLSDIDKQPENVYHSHAGKEHMGAIQRRKEDKAYLTLGLGASYEISPRNGVIPPWGVTEVTIVSRNDMPGCFDDELLCDIKDYRKYAIPLKLSVAGCPLVIERDSYGMSEKAVENSNGKKKLILNMGNACQGAEPLVREFRVRNNGSSPAMVTWKVRGLASKVNGPVKVDVKLVNKDGKVSVKPSISFWDDIAKDSPFVVEPSEAIIQPYNRRNFRITLKRTNFIGNEMAALIGSISFDYDLTTQQEDCYATDAISVGSVNSLNSVRSSSVSGRGNYKLNLEVKASLIDALIRVDKHEFKGNLDEPFLVPASQGIKLKTNAPKLFSKASPNNEICSKIITLMNPLVSAVSLTVAIDGQFTIKSMADGGHKKKTNSTMSQTHGKVSTSTSSSIGGPCILQTQESARFVITFIPRKSLRHSFEEINKSPKGQTAIEEKGNVTITWSTGQRVVIPVCAEIVSPFLSGSSPRLYFGTCHTSKSCSGTLLLSNPTDVVARWSVSHVKGGGASSKISSIKVPGYESKALQMDDPEVFEITPLDGTLEGPTVSTTATMYCPAHDVNRSQDAIINQRLVELSWAQQTLSIGDTLVHKNQHAYQSPIDSRYPFPVTIVFKPKKNIKYSCRFRFKCEFGNYYDVLCEGEGTYEEHQHDPLHPMPK